MPPRAKKPRCTAAFSLFTTSLPTSKIARFSFIDLAMCYDLFGEIPVTEDDVYQWVRAVSPRWLSPELSYRNYVRTYDVASKVQRAKLAGTFDSIVTRPVPQYHARLALQSIV